MYHSHAFLTLLCVLVIGSPLAAHDLRLVVAVEGKEITGLLSYPGGEPAAGTVVQFIDPRYKIVAEVTADAEGRFRQPVPVRCDYLIRARTIDLHHAEVTVKEEQLPTDLPPLPDSIPDSPHQITQSDEQFKREIQLELKLMREQIDRLESSIGLRDIVGGIGFIVGILGLLLFLRQRVR
ncbi:carboxypeptidase-like regulatory domain-containing protein [bacterium]|nr:carboxypeptidase-like regulatory domain-containing protein [bacterium]